MKFSQFVDVFVAALYNEAQLSGKDEFRVSEILEKYGLELNPTWGARIFDDYTFSSRVDVRRHIGPLVEQRVSLSSDGLRWVEDELGENVGTFLEQHGAHPYPAEQQPAPFDPQIFDPAIFDAGGAHVTDQQTDTVSSSTWTGLPKHGVLSPEASDRLLEALKVADDALEKSGASNHEMAQARAYIIAIRALAEAPEPPADMIWRLVERLNSIAGLASLFVAVIGHFS